MGKNEFVVTSLVGFLSLMFHSPQEVRVLEYIAVWLFVVDTVTGFGAAVATKEVKSQTFRVKMENKLKCYAIVISILYAATVGMKTWVPYQIAWSAVIASEVISLIENLDRFQKYSGIKLGVFSQAISIAAGYFQATQPHHDKIVTNTLMVPGTAETDDRPIISTTSVERMGKVPPPNQKP